MKPAGLSTTRRVVPGLVILLVTICLITPRPALAFSRAGTYTAIGAGIFSTLGAAAIGYGIWENLPQNRDKPRYFNGEFYAGGFAGASLVPNASWTFHNIPGGEITTGDVDYTNGVVGGLKFGYFLHSYPWLGFEAETNYTRNDIRSQNVSLSRPLNNNLIANFQTSSFFIWTMAFKIMGRYGFFPDKEVPFGRLQPYVGIGPGFVVIYGRDDAAKNFSLELQAGLRYMMLKNVSAFLEYKFSKQWDVELEEQTLWTVGTNMGLGKGTAHFDFDSHKIVLGVTYHF